MRDKFLFLTQVWILCSVLPLMRGGGNQSFGYPLSLGEDSEIYWKELDFAVLPWMRGGNQIRWTSLVTPLSLGEDPEICLKQYFFVSLPWMRGGVTKQSGYPPSR